MEPIVRKKLCEIVLNSPYGYEICNDYKWCEYLLNELCGEYKKEINIIVLSIKEGIVKELLNTPDTNIEPTLKQLSKKLIKEFGINKETAVWGVETWAIALGKKKESNILTNGLKNFYKELFELSKSSSENYYKTIEHYIRDIKNKYNEQEQFELHFNTGRYYFYSRVYEKAIEEFCKAIKFKPTNPDVHNLLGLCFYNKNEFDNAILNFDKAISYNPMEGVYFNNRGLCFYFKQEYKKAINDFNKAIELDKKNKIFFNNLKKTYYNYALLLYNNRDYTNSIDVLLKLLELAPNEPEYYNLCGLAYYMSSNYELSIKYLSKAIELNNRVGEYYNNRALNYHKQCLYEKALNDFFKATQLEPNNDIFNKNLKKLMFDLSKAYENKPEDVIYYNIRGVYFFEKKEYKQALKYFSKALKLKPDDPILQYNLKNTYLSLGISEEEAFKLLTSKEIFNLDKENKKEIIIIKDYTVKEKLFNNMVFIEAGEFTMGSEEANDEMPLHTIYLDGYYINIYTVSVKEFKEFLEDTGYIIEEFYENNDFNSEDNLPMVYVSYIDAIKYLNWLSVKNGLTPSYDENTLICNFNSNGYRLPTEAEWEKAAKGINNNKYPWGNEEPNNNLCNFNKNILKTVKIDSFPKGVSPYGLYNMAGNVQEWCNDWYSWDYYRLSPKNNPQGPYNGNLKVLRGGSWATNAYSLRTSYRNYAKVTKRANDIGFRYVCNKI